MPLFWYLNLEHFTPTKQNYFIKYSHYFTHLFSWSNHIADIKKPLLKKGCRLTEAYWLLTRQTTHFRSRRSNQKLIVAKYTLPRFFGIIVQKLFNWVSIEASSSLEGRSAGRSDRHTAAILTAISISSSSISCPRIVLSSTSRASPACCICLSHCPKLPPLAASPKNGSNGSLPVNRTPNMTPKLNTSLLSVYLLSSKRN